MNRSTYGFTLAAILGLWACGDTTADEPRPQTLTGLAMLDVPLVGATVEVRSPDGKLLFAEEADTHITGAFVLHVPGELPADFDLVVTGGNLGPAGPAFAGALRREVRGHDHEDYGFYTVDIVPTLVSAYRRAVPGRTQEAAHAAVWAFLDLPAELDRENDLHFHQDLFDPALFMVEANEHGGFETFVSQLVGEIDTPEGEPPCFSSRCGAPPQGAAAAAAGAVAKGALGKVGEEAAGWAMKEAFGWSDKTEEQQAAILDSLAEQATLLHGVIEELHHLETQLNAAKNEILTELTAARYEAKSDTLTTIRSFADARYEELYHLTLANPGDPSYGHQVTELARRLQDRDLEADLRTVHNTLVNPAPGEKGLLEIWGSIQHARAFREDRYPQLAAQLTYWFDVQVRLLHLRLEYLHYAYPDDTTMAANALSSFDARLEKQADAFLAWAESMAYVDYFLYYTDGFPFKERMRPFCWPSYNVPHLAQADQLVGQMLGRDPSLTVRLFLQASQYIRGNVTLDGVSLDLRNQATQAITTLPPRLVELPIWDIRPNHFPKTQLARYVFTGLPYGDYQLVDVNARYPRRGPNNDPLLDGETLAHVVPLTEAEPHTGLAAFAWNNHWIHSSTGCLGAAP